MRLERQSAWHRYWPITTLVALGAAFGAWHNAQARSGRQDGLSGPVRATVAAPASLLTGAGRWIGARAGWMVRGHELASENDGLARRVAELESENAVLRAAQAENGRLREDLQFVRTLRQPPLAADVWAMRPDPKFDTLIASRGRRDGVKPHDLVIRPEGVVGYISEADPVSSTVVLLTDQNAALGARVQRAGSRAVGLCRGTNGRLLTMTDLDNAADVRAGDVIVTSGLSRLYPKQLDATPPRDLVIGVVEQVQRDRLNSGKTALVRPNVAFDRIQEVYIL